MKSQPVARLHLPGSQRRAQGLADRCPKPQRGEAVCQQGQTARLDLRSPPSVVWPEPAKAPEQAAAESESQQPWQPHPVLSGRAKALRGDASRPRPWQSESGAPAPAAWLARADRHLRQPSSGAEPAARRPAMKQGLVDWHLPSVDWPKAAGGDAVPKEGSGRYRPGWRGLRRQWPDLA